MSIGGGQIRGALFFSKKVPFNVSSGRCPQFLKCTLTLPLFYYIIPFYYTPLSLTHSDTLLFYYHSFFGAAVSHLEKIWEHRFQLWSLEGSLAQRMQETVDK